MKIVSGASRDPVARCAAEDEIVCLDGSGDAPLLLAPCDLQAIKACGVTFMTSLMERIIEERAGGDPQYAEQIRAELLDGIGTDLRGIVPGSAAAVFRLAIDALHCIRRDRLLPP